MDKKPIESSDAPDQDPSDAEIHRVCAILESIANRFAEDSAEALAIRDAAIAYTVVHLRAGLKKSYEKLRSAVGGTLTEEMKADLRRHGIDPDELEDDEPEATMGR